MNPSYSWLWAKTDEENLPKWHPLPLHLLDVAACADMVLQREPEVTRKRMAQIIGLPWKDAKPWILLLAACHDLGKASPGFQWKWPGFETLLPQNKLSSPRNPDTNINHAFISQIALSALLQEQGWPQDIADLAADAVGCHHGLRASPTVLDRLAGNRSAMGGDDWKKVRQEIFEALCSVLKPLKTPSKTNLTGPDFMLLSGLTSFTDWIGSDENHFKFGTPEDCGDLEKWWTDRKKMAESVLDSIGWLPRQPLAASRRPLGDVFEYIQGFTPRPLQETVAEEVKKVKEPCVLLVEAPMGEGKTEAAFYAFLELQKILGHRGLYIALPTKATGNAMFLRTWEFLNSMKPGRMLDLQLVHGSAKQNEAFEKLRLSPVYDGSHGEGTVRAGEWFTHKKKALLSEYGVGTVDQALMTILPVWHYFMRLWGLANRVVVFDEIHAYDAYTGTLLLHLIQWLLAMGSSVILLSATLPPAFRRKLAQQVGADFPGTEAEYPRLSIFKQGFMKQRHFISDPTRRRNVAVRGVAPDIASVKECLEKGLPEEGRGLFLANTVQRAQDFYRALPKGESLKRKDTQIQVGKRLPDGTEVYLFHARYPADRRQAREESALELFGKDANRKGRKFLIATQVAEQSLDLDFDFMVIDLAPIDLVLQRAGRLWRHSRGHRPVSEPCLYVAGLEGERPPSFAGPLWWKAVYREDLLLRTWNLLKGRKTLCLPDEIDELVREVYDGLADVEDLGERLLEAEEKGEGNDYAYRNQAHQAFIGFPDDASWNDPARYARADEDEPGLHPTLVAQTRMGKPSVTVIPIFPQDGFLPEEKLNPAQAKTLSGRSVSLSRESVVRCLREKGVPEGWKKSSLLRNSIPLVLDENNRWTKDTSVLLDDELGLVYGIKEIS